MAQPSSTETPHLIRSGKDIWALSPKPYRALHTIWYRCSKEQPGEACCREMWNFFQDDLHKLAVSYV